MKRLLITIDGPAGAGKTTVSRALAERLAYRYIDTGALYRAIALEVSRRGIDPIDDAALEALCKRLELRFVRTSAGVRLLADGKDVGEHIRTPEITMLASTVSARPVVRRALLEIQRAMGREKGVVFEGRDMGTVVFPEADVKFFLIAAEDARARRRYLELKSAAGISLETVAADLRRRDNNDSTRAVAPLKPASDAVVIDSTSLTAEQVVQVMLERIRSAAR